MRLETRWLTILLLALGSGAGCGSSQEEQPPAAAATSGAEQMPPMQQAAPPPAPEPAAAPPAPEPAATPAANVAEPPKPQMPELAVVMIHEVKDYDTWKKAFDEHLQARKDAGFVGEGIMRGAENDKLVAVYLPATDLEKAKAFGESKDLKEKMKSAGVKGKPTIYTFKTAGGKMAPPDKTGLYGAILEAKVKDFAAFKTAIDTAATSGFDAAGIIGYGLGQSPDKPTEAYLYLQSEDLAKLKAYIASKDTKKAWKDAGVEGTPKSTLLKESSMTMYQQ